MGKTTRMNLISWDGPYADEKYRWKCSKCQKIYVSRSAAEKCYDKDEQLASILPFVREFKQKNRVKIIDNDRICVKCRWFEWKDKGIPYCKRFQSELPNFFAFNLCCKE